MPLTNYEGETIDEKFTYTLLPSLASILCLSTSRADGDRTYRIYIDPGHYEGDGGNKIELDTNLAVGLKLKELLESDTSSGVTWEILMSRYDSHSRERWLNSPPQRAIDANDFEADLFLSIHCNAGGGTGTETFWCNHYRAPGSSVNDILDEENRENSEHFAKLVQKHMVERGKWKNRRCMVDHDYEYFQDKWEENGGHLPILLRLKVPGCLNEIGFYDHSGDKEKLLSNGWRNKFAEAYRDAIYEYLRLPPADGNSP